jgi:hypothetical protein
VFKEDKVKLEHKVFKVSKEMPEKLDRKDQVDHKVQLDLMGIQHTK